jgi:hypothetical protein
MVMQGGKAMIIRYPNGEAREGVVLSSTENVMRLAMSGHDDILELYLVNGRWIAEDCRPVEVETAWDARMPIPSDLEDGFLCSREDADLLLSLIGSDDPSPISGRTM